MLRTLVPAFARFNNGATRLSWIYDDVTLECHGVEVVTGPLREPLTLDVVGLPRGASRLRTVGGLGGRGCAGEDTAARGMEVATAATTGADGEWAVATDDTAAGTADGMVVGAAATTTGADGVVAEATTMPPEATADDFPSRRRARRY